MKYSNGISRTVEDLVLFESPLYRRKQNSKTTTKSKQTPLKVITNKDLSEQSRASGAEFSTVLDSFWVLDNLKIPRVCSVGIPSYRKSSKCCRSAHPEASVVIKGLGTGKKKT